MHHGAEETLRWDRKAAARSPFHNGARGPASATFFALKIGIDNRRSRVRCTQVTETSAGGRARPVEGATLPAPRPQGWAGAALHPAAT